MKFSLFLIFVLTFLLISKGASAQSLAYLTKIETISALLNEKPELQVSFDKKTGTPLLNPPSISGVINDATDPALTKGITLSINKDGQGISASDYTITTQSNNEIVVSKDSILFKKSYGTAILYIHPSAAGYADITVTISAASQSKTLTINYAASFSNTHNQPTYWHTGVCDASDGADIDDQYFIIGDDEKNILFVYPRYQSGGPVATYSYGNFLGLKDCENGVCGEVDMEAVAKSPTQARRIYWLGSMSNGKAPKAKDKPNRNRLFVTDYTNTGSQTNLVFAGYYTDLKKYLIKWGDAAGYKFAKAAAPGQDCKSPEGFACEGMVFGPDNTTLYIGMRAPLVPVNNRNKAVIAPLQNFEAWFGKGSPTSPPVLGLPIELDLGGRGIRDIIRLSNGTYVIAAGNSGHGNNSMLYKWTGNPADAPVALPQFDTKDVNIEGLAEIKTNGKCSPNSIQIICDSGKEIYYEDATEAKNLGIAEFKKFRSIVLVAASKVW